MLYELWLRVYRQGVYEMVSGTYLVDGVGVASDDDCGKRLYGKAA
jgi:hypothetical protein